MISPHIIELPRRIEPVSRDTFLGGIEASPSGELAQVVALRPRDRIASRRPTPTPPVDPAPLAA